MSETSINFSSINLSSCLLDICKLFIATTSRVILTNGNLCKESILLLWNSFLLISFVGPYFCLEKMVNSQSLFTCSTPKMNLQTFLIKKKTLSHHEFTPACHTFLIFPFPHWNLLVIFPGSSSLFTHSQSYHRPLIILLLCTVLCTRKVLWKAVTNGCCLHVHAELHGVDEWIMGLS